MQVWTKVLIAGAALAVILGAAAGFLLSHVGGLPEVTALEEYKPSATTRVFSEDGELLAEFYMENRTPVPINAVPRDVIDAFLAVEDPRFYSHSGIDFSGIIRAMYQNLRAGRVVQGGSSITQQLAKMMFLDPERTLSRKLKEAYLAIQIERHYSKDEILDLYLNQVYLGSGAYGVEAAAHTYFGKPVSKLTLAEGAILAGLPAAPTRYSPLNDLQLAYSRRAHVLKRMYAEGFISKKQMQDAEKEPFVRIPAKKEQFKAPYFVEYIRRMLDEKYGETTLYRGGLNVYTTLNYQMQQMAEEAVENGLQQVEKRHHREGQQIQGALLAIEPHTGYIRAMVGGRDFGKSEFNRCTQALRQPGSAFKPIVYAAALDKGFGPDDTIMDSPVSYPGARKGLLWSPTNFDEKFEGEVTLRRALARSINVVAVKLLAQVGIPTAIEYAKKLGITTPLAPYLPLALGASDATLMEMATAYAVFDNYGIYTAPSPIIKITDREGQVVDAPVPAARQALSQDTAEEMTDMLTGVVRFGTGYQASSLGRPAAGKTGTTSNFNDAWFIGYVPSMVTGVWVGYDDHKEIGNRETGARAALPIWLDFMKTYVRELKVPYENFPAPPGYRNSAEPRSNVAGMPDNVMPDKTAGDETGEGDIDGEAAVSPAAGPNYAPVHGQGHPSESE
jgi:1A family penicillin-binding protein